MKELHECHIKFYKIFISNNNKNKKQKKKISYVIAWKSNIVNVSWNFLI